MPETQLLLVRHAQSQNNAKPEKDRVPDPSITELGVRQAELLAASMDRYRPTLLFCSPFLRSLQTILPVAKRVKIHPVIRQDLFEQGGCHSGFEAGKKIAERGMTASELQTQFPGWSLDPRIDDQGWNRLQEYETLAMARDRAREVRRWFESEQDRMEGERVLFMIHADFKLRLLEALLDIDDLQSQITEPANTSVSCLFRSDAGWKLHYWNQFHHLPNDLVTH